MKKINLTPMLVVLLLFACMLGIAVLSDLKAPS